MPFSSIWPAADQNWNFNVSSLAVLIGEERELRFRLSQRQLSQCLSMAPVVGLQNYVRSYEVLLPTAALTYSNPYGCANAPLRNKRFENAIASTGLLEDGNYSVFSIIASRNSCWTRHDLFLILWSIATWSFCGVIILFAILMPTTTWIGIANVTIFTGWSIILRTIEYINVVPSKAGDVGKPDGEDAIYILGRDNSALVLKGSRKDIKNWVTRGLVYKNRMPGPQGFWQAFTRLTSLLVLFLIFSTIPNGHTMDQLAFIMLNALAQANVLLGQWLNGSVLISELELDEQRNVKTRTEVWGNLIKQFKDLNATNGWIEKLNLLPNTDKWKVWKEEFLKDVTQDPKVLYNNLPGR